jgi:hypothetical protein
MTDRAPLGSGTDGATRADLEQLASSRARATGRPVVVAGFVASGQARVYDVNGDPAVDELELDHLGAVPIEPSRLLGEPAAPHHPA